MELYDEVKEQKKSKAPMFIIFAIVLLTLITIMIVIGIFYLKDSIVKISIDGKRNLQIEKIFYVETTEQGTKLYVPIIKMAEYVGYEGFNGDYKIKSEDKTKCHVKCENETVQFTLDSKLLVKITENAENEYVELDEPVFEKNGELYTTIEGVQNAFNVLFAHDEEFKNINIYTMNFLTEYHALKLKLDKYSKEFTDQKAILQNMIIVEQNKKYGVLDIKTGKPVLEAKYETVSYLPTTNEFLVKSNGKYGVVSKDATIIVKIAYDQIKSMDNQQGLYLVKQNGSYGVIDINGNIIINAEYKQIGINNIKRYTQNGVDNQYVLLNEIIPIQNQEKLWAFFNVKGNKITDFKYTDIGCNSTTVANSYSAVVIPSDKIIIVQEDKKYDLVTTGGEELTPGVDSVYLKTDTATGENKFFMTNNDKNLSV